MDRGVFQAVVPADAREGSDFKDIHWLDFTI
jgi:hypothetical protein